MIGCLRGQILVKQPPRLLLDVGGVGYELEAPMTTFYELPAVGETVILVTHLAVREDAHSLYGFLHERERSLFRGLLRVTGVGARMALAILSAMDAKRFVQCVEQEDSLSLTRVPGIGKKTAERLIVEMRDRVNGLLEGQALAAPDRRAGAASRDDTPGAARDQALADAVSALVALGYRPPDAQRMARAVDDGALTAEAIIRAALRSVNPV